MLAFAKAMSNIQGNTKDVKYKEHRPRAVHDMHPKNCLNSLLGSKGREIPI